MDFTQIAGEVFPSGDASTCAFCVTNVIFVNIYKKDVRKSTSPPVKNSRNPLDFSEKILYHIDNTYHGVLSPPFHILCDRHRSTIPVFGLNQVNTETADVE